jgi:subtilisin family serine protease
LVAALALASTSLASESLHAEASALAAHRFAAGAIEAIPQLAYNPTAVLVRFEDGAAEEYKQTVRALVGDGSFRIVESGLGIELVNTKVRVEVAIERLSPFVKYAERDWVVRKSLTPNDPGYAQLWGMHNTGQTVNADPGVAGADINAPEAWDTYTGDATFKVAIIDTGVQYTHPDLAANIWTNPGEIAGNGIDDDANGYVDDTRGWDFFSIDNNPDDTDGHGTHTAGTVGAVGNNGVGVAGVAWNCKLIPLRFLGPTGGFTSDAVLAVNYCRTNNIKVSNNSWGGGGFTQSLFDAINNAKSVGHLFVAAAGNSNINMDVSQQYPGGYNLDNIICVASMTNNDTRSSFSNYGAISVDLGAPGSTIYSTYLNGGYAYLSGTSMASPHVAGAAVLVYGQNPAWTYTQVRSRILTTTRALTGLSGVVATGGVLNLQAALSSAPPGNSAPTVTITAPSANLTTTTGTAVTFAGSANDTEDGVLTANLVWTSNLIGQIGTGATFTTTALTVGTHTITARVTDSGGLQGAATRTVTVNNPTAPVAPSNLAVRRQSAGVARITWRDRSNNETSFEIERQQNVGGVWTNTTFFSSPANSTATTNTAGVGSWRYRIRARNGTAASAWTGYRTVTL